MQYLNVHKIISVVYMHFLPNGIYLKNRIMQTSWVFDQQVTYTKFWRFDSSENFADNILADFFVI